MHESVTVHMAAPPDRVWDLVSDVTRIGRYSPETFGAEWIEGATGPALGARFRGHVNRNRRGIKYSTTCTVTACDPGKTFAFGVGAAGKPPLSVWGYEIAPADGGCDVTESFTLSPVWWLRLYWALLGWSRGKTNRNNMRITLERVRDDAEASPAGAGPAAHLDS